MGINVEDFGLLPFDLMHNSHFQGGVFLFFVMLQPCSSLISQSRKPQPWSQAKEKVTTTFYYRTIDIMHVHNMFTNVLLLSNDNKIL